MSGDLLNSINMKDFSIVVLHSPTFILLGSYLSFIFQQMEAERSSETSVPHSNITRSHNPEDAQLELYEARLKS
jgi:hypothetical protein